jgi:hypothetical protein
MSRRKRIVILIIAALGVYLISYALLSFCGGYRIVMSGNARPTGLAFGDTFAWQLRFGVCFPFHTALGENTYRFDALGLFYLPLIRLDQTYVHRSRPYITFDATGEPHNHPWPAIEEMHPTVRRQIRLVDAAMARHKTEIDAARARRDWKDISRIEKLAQEEAERDSEKGP